jgi:phospholipid transport system substrate-binding protein
MAGLRKRYKMQTYQAPLLRGFFMHRLSAAFLVALLAFAMPMGGVAKSSSDAASKPAPQTASDKTTKTSGQTQPAQLFMDLLAQDLLKTVKNDALDDDKKLKKLQTMFENSVDIAWVAKFVLGRHFRTATPEQKTAYLKAYPSFLVNNYVARLMKYTGQTYRIIDTKKNENGDYVVAMELQDPDGPPILLDYRLHKKAGTFKVIDIVVESISLITTQRSEFNAVVNRKGLDRLITALEKKAKLASAAK